ncbi:MAG: hypothetical protein JJE22_06680 [Bacteroidia bacterium]|nr:hypothetical protein [Bacteroidia bacterium]
MKKFAFIVMIVLLLPVSLLAHPGHGGTDGFSITHYFVEPEHAITTVSFIVLFAGVVYYRWKKAKSKG